MHYSTTHHRALSLLTATLVALALAAAPALAGENDDDGDDESPASSQPAPAAAGMPQGGVATGFGGTAPAGNDSALFGVLTLVAGAGGILALRRRAS